MKTAFKTWCSVAAWAALVGVVVHLPRPAAAEMYLGLKERGKVLKREMMRRGDPPGEVALALASLFARAAKQKETLYFIQQARQHGIKPGRLDLVLSDLFRGVGRYDAAFSTLVRVLVRHPDQPYALVQLWKTLYQVTLQGVEVRTDLILVRRKLAAAGLHFPVRFDPAKASNRRSKELVAAGYNALMAERNDYAAGLFEAALDANPSNPHGHRGLAIARARTEDYARAAGAYLIYLELLPNAPDAATVEKVLMAYWQNRQGEFEQSR